MEAIAGTSGAPAILRAHQLRKSPPAVNWDGCRWGFIDVK